MSFLKDIWFRLNTVMGRNRCEAVMEDEMEFHLDMAIQEKIDRGIDPKIAKKQALKEFGSVEGLKEECRESWGVLAVLGFIRNLRFGFRLLVKYSGSSLMAVFVLAVSISLTVTTFTLVNGFLWSDVGLRNSEQIVFLEWTGVKGEKGGRGRINIRDFRVFQKEIESLERMAAYESFFPSFKLNSTNSFAVRYRGARVSSNFFKVIGIHPTIGQDFSTNDIGSSEQNSVIISDFLWRKEFNESRSVVGSSVLVDGGIYTIIGVMPPGYNFPIAENIWVHTSWQETDLMRRADLPGLEVISQMKSGVLSGQVVAEMNAIATQLASEFPEANVNRTSIKTLEYMEKFQGGGGIFKVVMITLLVLGLLVLSVACVNVFNIILARCANRSVELTIRRSLGAARANLISQVLIDGFIISSLGAVVGLLFAYAFVKLLWNAVNSLNLLVFPFWVHMNIDGRVIAFVIAVVLLTTLASSLIPALRAAQGESFEMLKDSNRTSSGIFIGRLSRFLVGGQIAVSVTILIVSFMMINVWSGIIAVEFPFEAKQVLLTSLDLSERQEFDSDARKLAFFDELQRELEVQPGVLQVAYTDSRDGMFPNNQRFEKQGIAYEDRSSMPQSGLLTVSDKAFDVLGLNLLSGRLFNRLDIQTTQKVCVVGMAFVEEHFEGENPVGERIRFHRGIKNDSEWMTIVGMVSKQNLDPQKNEMGRTAGVYVPQAQWPKAKMTVLVPVTGDGQQYIEPVRKAIELLAPGLAPSLEGSATFLTVKDFIGQENALFDSVNGFLLVTAVIGILIASIGLYAILAFFARVRWREFGIRVAIGASSRNIVSQVLKAGQVQVLVGILFGLAGGLGLTRLMLGFINLPSYNPNYFLVIYVILGVIIFCVVAMGIPALRASKIDPAKTLRSE